MQKITVVLVLALFWMAGCNKSSPPAAAANAAAPGPRSSPSSGPVQQKLQEEAGSGATNCGNFDVHATAAQLKGASDCSMQANQAKHPFYVSYDMPGMSVGVAGAADGKLFTVQAQGGAAGAALTSGACPSPLRVATSGRVTCFAPGDMSSMSGSHTAGAMPSGTSNPHAGGSTANPHAAQKTQ
jgi:hypothetical protein